MINIISQFSDFALKIIGQAGYMGVFVLSVLESAAVPIPSEVVVPFSGFLAVLGRFNFWLVVAAATLGNLAGSGVLYAIGRSGGRWLLERYGKYVLIKKQDLETGDRWFKKYGTRAVFFSRMMPVVRTFVSLPAGIAEMNFGRFVIFTFLGSLPWNFALALLGYKAGEKWGLLNNYFRRLDIVIAVSIVAAVIWYIWKHKKHE